MDNGQYERASDRRRILEIHVCGQQRLFTKQQATDMRDHRPRRPSNGPRDCARHHTRLYAVARREALLDDRRERCDLRRPADRIVLLEAVEQRLEHVVQLRRRLVPPYDRIAEPQ